MYEVQSAQDSAAHSCLYLWMHLQSPDAEADPVPFWFRQLPWSGETEGRRHSASIVSSSRVSRVHSLEAEGVVEDDGRAPTNFYATTEISQ